MATIANVDERLVTEIWERQAFDRSALDALGIEVVFRGVPSDAGGPDFQDSVLTTSNKLLSFGDIEFHVASSDWYRHGHHLDTAYNRVALHVVWVHDSDDTHTADGRRVPVLALSPVAWITAQSTDRTLQASLLPHPCEETYQSLSSDAIRAKIHHLGIQRFRSRVDDFLAELESLPADQVAYSALMEAMGYASNRESFRLLAEAAPYAWLRSVSPDLWTEILLYASGLGPKSDVSPPGRLSPECWRLSRIRPANHPALRLLGVAVLLQKMLPSLAAAIEARVMATKRPGELQAWLMARHNARWLIGSGRAGELLVSVVLPFCGALRPDSRHPEELFGACPSPPYNRWTRIMQKQLATAGHRLKPRLAVEHQGMHHLYHQYCRPQRRTDCPVCNP